MSLASYYEVIPQAFLDRLTSDPELLSAFSAMWGYGSGMHYWFDRIDPDVEDLIAAHSEAAISNLQVFIAETRNFPSAYVEGTHETHMTMLTSAFTATGAPAPAGFARTVIDGNEAWEHNIALTIVDTQRCSSSVAESVCESFGGQGFYQP